MAKLIIKQHYVNVDGKVVELKKGDEVPEKLADKLVKQGYAEVEAETPKPRPSKK